MKTAIFLKEENSHLYNVSAYFTGRTLVELPFFVLTPLIWSLITYFAVGLNTEVTSQFFIFLGVAVLQSLCKLLLNYFCNVLTLQFSFKFFINKYHIQLNL